MTFAERARLEVMVTAELGLSETVLFLGRRNDVPRLPACCCIYLFFALLCRGIAQFRARGDGGRTPGCGDAGGGHTGDHR